jgi:hypothetical protein
MFTGRFIFSQLMFHLPLSTFRRCVEQYDGEHKIQSFSCLDHYLAMAFAQLTFRESLRDIEACLRSQQSKLYHLGFRCEMVSRNTLSNANSVRDWRIYADFAAHLIRMAEPLYATEELGFDLKHTLYALDATTIDLCLTLFPWAHFRPTKAAVKLHTLLNLRGNIPNFICITEGKCHEVKLLDSLPLETGAFYLLDRGYLDFARLYRFLEARAFFLIRAKKNLRFERRYSKPVDRSTGIICDQVGVLAVKSSKAHYQEPLRRIKCKDLETNQTIVLLTNHLSLPVETLALMYRKRWQIELFFKWIKQHLRIKAFFGNSENAIKTQIWIAISVYVLIAIIKKRLNLNHSLYEILQILSVTLFDKTPLTQLFSIPPNKTIQPNTPKQLSLFDLTLGQ